ncbi:hypothetical protein BHE74_00048968 [Ensete ventricosum]|nr:hypothetical protein BHE74_00048968 [Ensete ventricosum]RZS00536.1 hypothetical protein BHM03_00030235 [Ensete ventricosum]
MKGGISPVPGDYVYFKSQVPLHKISVRSFPSLLFLFARVGSVSNVVIGNNQWRYYDFGPKAVPPLICIPGIAGTADVYYKQIKSLSMKSFYPRFAISIFTARYGRYIPVRQVAGTRTARYRAVQPKIDLRWSIEREKGRKKKKKKKKKKKEKRRKRILIARVWSSPVFCRRSCAVVAHGSPAPTCRRRPRVASAHASSSPAGR